MLSTRSPLPKGLPMTALSGVVWMISSQAANFASRVMRRHCHTR